MLPVPCRERTATNVQCSISASKLESQTQCPNHGERGSTGVVRDSVATLGKAKASAAVKLSASVCFT